MSKFTRHFKTTNTQGPEQMLEVISVLKMDKGPGHGSRLPMGHRT